MQKMIPAIQVHTHVVGTVSGYLQMREAAASKPPRKRNLRDVVGARQSPTIREVFAPAA